MFSGEELLELRRAWRATSRSTTTRARCCRSAPAVELEELAKRVEGAGRARWARDGSLIHRRTARRIEIPAVKAERVVDPTGCGDAYRAGLLYGIAQGLDWPTHRPPRLAAGLDQDRAARRRRTTSLRATRSRRASAAPSATRRGRADALAQARRIFAADSSSRSRGGFFTGQARFMPSFSWRGTQVHVEMEHGLPGRLAVRLVDRQPLGRTRRASRRATLRRRAEHRRRLRVVRAHRGSRRAPSPPPARGPGSPGRGP